MGESTAISVTFTNTGDTAWNFIAGATVWDSGGNQVANYSQTLSTALQPGQQKSVSWNHPVNDAGDYWLQFGVWKDTPYTSENLLDKEPSPSQNLVRGIPPPQQPTIDYSPSSFSFSATQGGSNPSSQTLSIRNSGGGALDWSVSDDAGWLSLSPTSGSSTGETDSVAVSVSISGMSVGSYSATITISASEATNTPQTVPVSLTITEESISVPDAPTGPTSSKTNQSLSYSTGGASSNLGHSLEYRFDWGDGSLSGWSSSTSASYSWSTAGTYTVKTQARCATHTTVLSDWSAGLTVEITEESTLTGPLQGTIAFRRDVDGSSEIAVINPDVSGLASLSQQGTAPAWSPDGTKIAFVNNNDIYVMNADGTGVARITETPEWEMDPAWSPDGSKIAFARVPPLWQEPADVWIMNANGSGQTQLTSHPTEDRMPSWSPDGAKIAFVSHREGGDIWVMNANGSGQANLIDDADWEFIDEDPAWSPDGSKIAFAADREKRGGRDIYIMNTNGSNITKLTTPVGDNAHPSWSPDGTKIAFASNREGNYDIYIMNADGSGEARLTSGSVDESGPSWGAGVAGVPAKEPDIGDVNSIDFGNVVIGDSLDKTTTIYNQGNATLTVQSITRASGSSDFTYVGPSTPFDVGAGGSKTVTVRFAPSSEGAKNATFTIDSNDPDEASITFAASGTGTNGATRVDSLSVSPSSVTLGSSFTISYSVSDTGGSGLNRVELWQADDSNGTPVNWGEVKRAPVSGNSDSGFFTDTPSSAGFYWYGIHVVDNTGNWAPEDSPVRVEVTEADTTLADDVYWFAKVIASEAGSVWDIDHWVRCSDEERSAVGWTVLNRLESGEHGQTIEEVVTEPGQYAYNQEPTLEIKELSRKLTEGQIPDPTAGATHFFSPISMPKEGEPTEGFDVGGELHEVPGINERVYFPSWTNTLTWVGDLDNVRRAYFMFYRSNQPPIASFTISPVDSIRSGDVVHFDASSSYDVDGTIVSYEWLFDDGERAVGREVEHRFRGQMQAPKTYNVSLIVKDDNGAVGEKTIQIAVKGLKRIVEVRRIPGTPLEQEAYARMTVSYNWVDTINGEDVYIISRISTASDGFVGAYSFFILDAYSRPDPLVIWWDILPSQVGEIYASPFPTHVPPSLSRLFPNWEPRSPELRFYGEDFFEGLVVHDSDVMSIRATGWPAGIHFGTDPRVVMLKALATALFEEDSAYFEPERAEEPHIPIDINDFDLAHLCSPGELRVYDSQGRVTGLVNGEVKEEIPYSEYSDSTIIILLPSDSYKYEVAGTDEGTFGLIVISVENEEVNDFTLTDVPTSASTVHQYTIDWDALSQGEKGVTMQVDADGDGTFEQTTIIQPPIASFTYLPEDPLVSEEITFDASESYDVDGGIVSYEWNFGDGNTSSGRVVAHTYSTPGDYAVSLTTVDDDGVLSTYSMSIQIRERQQGLPTWVWIALGLVAALAAGFMVWRHMATKQAPKS